MNLPRSFTVANEDCSASPKSSIEAGANSNEPQHQGLYTFDMRKLSAAMYRHWDHVMAVSGCGLRTERHARQHRVWPAASISDTTLAAGQEFVSASYDNTVRLWNCTAQRSREALGSRCFGFEAWSCSICLASLCRSIMESECSNLAAPSAQK